MLKRCVVTGASGFIGGKLCQRLKTQGTYVLGIVSHNSACSCDTTRVVEISRPIDSGIFNGADTVFHLAGKAHALSEVEADSGEYFRVNTEGTRCVLEASSFARVRRFIFVSSVKAMSSDEVRTQPQQGFERCFRAWCEADTVEPDTPYGRSKLEAEQLVLHGGFVPEPVVLRLSVVYGAGAKGNIQKMLHAVSMGRFPPITEVGNRRSMVHVQDVIQASMLAAEKPEAIGEAFIVSDGQPYSTRQMFELMCHALGRRIPSWTVPLWILAALGLAGDVIGRARGRRFFFDSDALAKLTGSAWFSSRKIESMLGFKPEWTLEKALPEMVEEMRSAQRITRRTDEG